MTGMDDAFCSSTRPRRSMHRARADRVGHRAPEVSYWASSRPIVGLSKRQSTCSRDLYLPHARLAGLPGYVAGVRCVSLDVHQTYEKSSSRKPAVSKVATYRILTQLSEYLGLNCGAGAGRRVA